MGDGDCILAATGGEGTMLWGALALVLMIAGVGLLLGTRRRRRMLAGLASTAAVLAIVAGALIPVQSASAADCPPRPTPSPTVPVVTQLPDLVPSFTVPDSVDGSAPLVVTVANIGPGSTSGSVVLTVALPIDSGFALSFDPAVTNVVVGGVGHDVQNGAFTLTGSGVAGDPFVVTTTAAIPPGSSISFSLTAIVQSENGGSAVLVAEVAPGTGGGETPTTNNSATATLSAAVRGCVASSDKSPVLDTDADGVVDACDLDSDNDGILDVEEDLNRNGLFEDDDVDGDLLVTPVLGDGISTYLDLDSENDGVLDLMEGRPLTRAQIDLYDADHNGVFDASQSFGANGLLDALETAPDSGILRPEFASLRNTDGDDKPDHVDARSNGADFDLYQIGRSDLDDLGGGFISRLSDTDADGIQAVIDTDLIGRGAPGSPYSPYSS